MFWKKDYLLIFCQIGHHKDAFNFVLPDHAPGVWKGNFCGTYNMLQYIVCYLLRASWTCTDPPRI